MIHDDYKTVTFFDRFKLLTKRACTRNSYISGKVYIEEDSQGRKDRSWISVNLAIHDGSKVVSVESYSSDLGDAKASLVAIRRMREFLEEMERSIEEAIRNKKERTK